MKYVAIILTVIAVLGVILLFTIPVPEPEPTQEEGVGAPTTDDTLSDAPLYEVVAEGLEIPWDIAFLPAQAGLPNGSMLVTERTGQLVEINAEGTKHEIPIEGVRVSGEGGLLGVVLHPNFVSNNFLYLYMGTPSGTGQTKNRVVRYTFVDGTLTEDRVIIDNIPGAIFHDGGRIEFGPDGLLYITTGDATNPDIAQDIDSLGGKILRLNDDGSVPSNNPFTSTGSVQVATAVYSYGHRNPQGLAWDSAGRLWQTEHGRSGLRSGLDELNLIEAGANYGWPESEGEDVAPNTVGPVRHSGPSTTWAPASLAYLNGSLYFGGLRGEALYEVVLNGVQVQEFKEHFKGQFGRIRTVRVGPDGLLYITTSNRDGRGSVEPGDDKIIRINPELL